MSTINVLYNALCIFSSCSIVASAIFMLHSVLLLISVIFFYLLR